MSYPPVVLIDSGVLVAYYNARDNYHLQIRTFFEQYTGRLVTTLSCITEVMWLLNSNWRLQNRFLDGVAKEVFECCTLLPQDCTRIAELNAQYSDLPADFADLSLIAISERLNIAAILTLDSDFDVYRRYRTQPFERILLSN
jgi:predicted nucleic acid-binding protein